MIEKFFMPVVTATFCGITRSPNVCSVRVCACVQFFVIV